MQKQLQQQSGGGGGPRILIRGSVPPGLNPQQQVQWLQQQAKQQGVVLPPHLQQQTQISPNNQQNISVVSWKKCSKHRICILESTVYTFINI